MQAQVFSEQVRQRPRSDRRTNQQDSVSARHPEQIYSDNLSSRLSRPLRSDRPARPETPICLARHPVHYSFPSLFFLHSFIRFVTRYTVTFFVSFIQGFGSANATATTMTGTVVKFTPVITTDSMSKNGISHSISARHCCIASMKEYESKSYEELRFEDYSVGRKGNVARQSKQDCRYSETSHR